MTKEVFEIENATTKRRVTRLSLKKCIHAVSNFIALIPFRSIRQMEVNYSGIKFENSLPNIRKRKKESFMYPEYEEVFCGIRAAMPKKCKNKQKKKT